MDIVLHLNTPRPAQGYKVRARGVLVVRLNTCSTPELQGAGRPSGAVGISQGTGSGLPRTVLHQNTSSSALVALRAPTLS